MGKYHAQVSWRREGAKFIDNRYSRSHEWAFDGGFRVPASSSPMIVPVPMSEPAYVDPEEALVASASSCHMLWFLSIAARRGFVVDSYVDQAAGIMGTDAQGKRAIIRITLRPRLEFFGGRSPTAVEIQEMHEESHESCFIANSLKCEVVVEPA
jgi:organic hydroperoxide reductase OsmC/OhrA